MTVETAFETALSQGTNWSQDEDKLKLRDGLSASLLVNDCYISFTRGRTNAPAGESNQLEQVLAVMGWKAPTRVEEHRLDEASIPYGGFLDHFRIYRTRRYVFFL